MHIFIDKGILLINTRFKQVRIFLKLSQTAFGQRIEKSLRAIQSYEDGSRSVTDGILFQLEKEFNVNSDWMKTGVGDMFNSAEGGVSAGSSRALTLHEETIIQYYNELTEADKKEIFGYLQKAAEAKRIKRNFSDRIKKEQAG